MAGADRQQLLSDWYARYQRQRRRGRSAILSTCSRRPSVSDRLSLVRCSSALARRGGGNYPQALIDFLLVEVAMMLLLGR